jgi:hypothetical protein
MKMPDVEQVMVGACSLTLSGVSFENPDVKMLIPDSESLERHITMQPAAIAYYGTLAKQAQRLLDEAKKKWKYRWMELYGTVSRALCLADPKRKPTVTEIEAETYSRHRSEVDAQEQELARLAHQADDIQAFYESWQAKSFAVSQMVQLTVAGLFTKDGYEAGENLGGHKEGWKAQAARLRATAERDTVPGPQE